MILGPHRVGKTAVLYQTVRCLDTMLFDDAATFLQRCSRHDIGWLDHPATRSAKAGMIVPVGKGRVDFAHHAARAWL